MSWLGLVLASYLVGAIPFSLLVGSWWCDVDVRDVGSGNPGATNLLRIGGAGPALLALLLDLGKGALPVCVALRLEAPAAVAGGIAAAAVAGHVFPPYLAFRGGKGVATAVGALAPLAPAAVAGGVGLFAAVVGGTRLVSLGSVVLVASVPLLAALFARVGWSGAPDLATLLAAATIALLVIFRHAGNISRLLDGSEPRLGDGLGANR